MNAISPALSGQKAYNFQNLNPSQALQMPTYGSTGALAPQQSTYNYQPQQVQSNYNYNPAQVKSTLDNSQFTQDYFNQGIKAPLLRTYDQSIAPRINDVAASNGSTFSTRTQVAKQQALGDLQTQMSAQLSNAVRQDQIEKSQQDLSAQQFNTQTGIQNAQFGSAQNFQAQGLNQAAGLNSAQFGAGQNLDYAKMNSANQQMLDQLNSQNRLQATGLNNQNRLAYDSLNTNTNVQLGENARQNQMQAATMAQQFNQAPYQTALMGEQLLNPLQSYNNANAQNQYAQWQMQQPYNSPYIGLALQAAGLNPNTIAKANPTAMQQALQGLGIAGAGASLLGGLGTGGAGAATGADLGALSGGALGAGGVVGAGSAGGGGLLAGLGSGIADWGGALLSLLAL